MVFFFLQYMLLHSHILFLQFGLILFDFVSSGILQLQLLLRGNVWAHIAFYVLYTHLCARRNWQPLTANTDHSLISSLERNLLCLFNKKRIFTFALPLMNIANCFCRSTYVALVLDLLGVLIFTNVYAQFAF